MSWDALTRAVHERFVVTGGGPDWVCIQWPAHRQTQRIQLVADKHDVEVVLVICDLGPIDRVPMAAMLDLNMTMAFGAAAHLRGRCVLRWATRLADLQLDTFVAAMTYVAATASRVRATQLPTGGARAFNHFAD